MAKKKKKSNKTRLLVILLILVILVLGVLCAIYFTAQYYYNKSYVSDSEVTIIDIENNEDITEAETLDSQAEELFNDAAGAVSQINIIGDKDVYNILLIGSDTRRGSGYGNSDAMILMSINQKSKTIFLTSFMRDLYANIPNVGVRKLNAAYAVGGGPLLVQTIESNYRIDIDNYASVNFNSMATIIDLVGGVDVNVSPEEARYANSYMKESCGLLGIDPAPYFISGGGLTHLNGIQAVGFSRIRYTSHGSENYDYGRTSRQREVLVQLFDKAKQLDVVQLPGVITEGIQLVTHNIEQGVLVDLIADAPAFLKYNVVTSRIPYDGMYNSVNEQLIPDFEATIQRLHSEIYGG